MNDSPVTITGMQLESSFRRHKSEIQNGTKMLIANKLVQTLSKYEAIDPVLFINTGEEVIQSLKAECGITETCHLFWREIFLVRLAIKICPHDFAREIKEAMENMIFVEEPGGLKGIRISFSKKIIIRLMFWL